MSVIGDILGPAITHSDHLIDMPVGVGEPNIARLLPSVLVFGKSARIKISVETFLLKRLH